VSSGNTCILFNKIKFSSNVKCGNLPPLQIVCDRFNIVIAFSTSNEMKLSSTINRWCRICMLC